LFVRNALNWKSQLQIKLLIQSCNLNTSSSKFVLKISFSNWPKITHHHFYRNYQIHCFRYMSYCYLWPVWIYSVLYIIVISSLFRYTVFLCNIDISDLFGSTVLFIIFLSMACLDIQYNCSLLLSMANLDIQCYCILMLWGAWLDIEYYCTLFLSVDCFDIQ
jgi:hypothetical protein